MEKLLRKKKNTGASSELAKVIGLERIDKKWLDKHPKLKILGIAATGLDRVDLQECSKRGIKIISLRDYPVFLRTINATAEHTWGLILSLVRNIPWAYGHVLKGNWDRERWRGHDLQGKTILVVGVGRIGHKILAYARAFGMKVLHINTKDKKKLLTLLPNADIVTLHIHLENNENYFDKDCFKKMKQGSYFINTSRGGIIDEDALLLALQQKKIARAGLDVVRGEPDKINKKLLKQPNLIVTPHLGGATFEAMEKTRLFIEQKVNKELKKYGI